jgi:hypothetical protein
LAAARRACSDIARGAFYPRKDLVPSRRGVHRLFAPLPQFGFKTRYMSVNSQMLRSLLGMAWPKERGLPEGLERLPTAKDKDGLWGFVFRLERLKGVQVPGMPEGSRSTESQFQHLFQTDGFACSFTCDRPAREPEPGPTAETVRITEDTILKAADPGVRSIVEVCTFKVGPGTGEDSKIGFSSEGE